MWDHPLKPLVKTERNRGRSDKQREQRLRFSRNLSDRRKEKKYPSVVRRRETSRVGGGRKEKVFRNSN